MQTINKEFLRDKFVSEAVEHGKAIADGDRKKANKIHSAIQGLYAEAKRENLVDVFAEFLDDANENVRLWAATFTLAVSPAIAEKSLQRLSDLPKITGLTAQTTLELWKTGNLTLL